MSDPYLDIKIRNAIRGPGAGQMEYRTYVCPVPGCKETKRDLTSHVRCSKHGCVMEEVR